MSLAIRFRDGVLLAKEESARADLGFRVPSIWRVSSGVAYVANGNLGDMYYLHDVLCGRRPRSVSATARIIRSELHQHSVRLDVRPLALLILLGGFELARPVLYGFDVIGSQFECNAWAHGVGDARARSVLEKDWRAGLSLSAAEKLARHAYGRRGFEVAVLRPRARHGGRSREPDRAAKEPGA